ncbi:Protein FAR1-RELATED SEQUENCE [Dirofilaria immitis]
MVIYRTINTHAGTISLHVREVHAAISLSYLKDQAISLYHEDKAYQNLVQIQEYNEKRDRQCRTTPSFMYLSNHTLALPTLSFKRMISPFRCPVASTTETYYYEQPISSWIQSVQMPSITDNIETELITTSQPPSPPPPSPLKPNILQQELQAKFTENLIETCAEYLSQINEREISRSFTIVSK